MTPPVLTSARLRELRVLAEGATPGPWRSLDADHSRFDGICRVGGFDRPVPEGVIWQKDARPVPAECRHQCNADYIAAANPETILSLLSLVERQQAALAEISEKQVERMDAFDARNALAAYDRLVTRIRATARAALIPADGERNPG